MLAVLILFATVGMAISGCGGSSSSSGDAPKGTYTLAITGTDSTSSSIPAATTTFTLTIQ
jgi:nicotinamide mononucleotide (NMN) deamidase PncC